MSGTTVRVYERGKVEEREWMALPLSKRKEVADRIERAARLPVPLSARMVAMYAETPWMSDYGMARILRTTEGNIRRARARLLQRGTLERRPTGIGNKHTYHPAE